MDVGGPPAQAVDLPPARRGLAEHPEHMMAGEAISSRDDCRQAMRAVAIIHRQAMVDAFTPDMLDGHGDKSTVVSDVSDIEQSCI